MCLSLLLIWCGMAAAIDGEKMRAVDGVIEHYEVHNADITSICKQLSAFSGIDIIVSDKVKCSVSLTLSNKTWQDILQIVCRVNNLALLNEGSYYFVQSREEQSKQIVDDASKFQASQELGPLRREIIRIFHTPADDMSKSIQTLLSTRGKLTVVEHTNALIVYDTEENINQIRRMVTQLDVETAQLSISCKIIEASSGVVQRLGIHWGYSDAQQGMDAAHIAKPGVEGGVVNDALDHISYGIINRQNLSAALEYLYGDNKGEIIAQPQITTVDNKEARIFMGQQVPVKYLDEAGNTVVKMINAGTELIVKPHISGEGRILLELSPKKESYIRQSDGTPVINQQSATTNVVVNNGETVVIAGLTSNETTSSEEGIPVLKDIPLLGHLFKRSEKNHDKKDLIIFVTPHIINGGLSAAAVETKGEVAAEK